MASDGDFEIAQGIVRAAGNARTTHGALNRLVELVAGWGPAQRYAIIHADNPGLCSELEERLSARVPLDGRLRGEVGPTIVTHVGPGAVGVAAILNPA